MIVLAGSTDVTTYFHLRLAADGTDATGLTISNVDMQYTRSGVAPTAKVDAVALAATDTAHTDNRGIEIDATDQPGLYRFDWPDAAFAAGVRETLLTIKVATAFTETLRVEIVGYNPAAALATPTNITAGTITTVSGNVSGNVVGSVGSVTGLTASNLDATISSRASQTSVDDLPTNAELATALGTADDAVLTAINDLPTNAELATALAGADDATLAAIAALNNLSAAQVNAEVLDVLNVDTFAQPGQGTPAATTSIRLMLAYIYKAWRNKTEQTSSQYSLLNDDAATVDQKATFADDATTATRGEIVTGP